MKNENNLADMCQILESFNQYVPTQVSTNRISVDGKEHVVDNTKLTKILFFGDQLTAAWAHGAAILHEPQKQKLDRLEGFIPTIADWHARMCFLQVCIRTYYNMLLVSTCLFLCYMHMQLQQPNVARKPMMM